MPQAGQEAHQNSISCITHLEKNDSDNHESMNLEALSIKGDEPMTEVCNCDFPLLSEVC
jgi:hypothetical protein